MRECVAPGNIPYSAVTQPEPLPFSQGGQRSSTLAVQITRVSPKAINVEPAACLVYCRVIETGRNWSTCLPLGRMVFRIPGCVYRARREKAQDYNSVEKDTSSMPNSMTGYGRHAADTELGEITWELRSVNHRYLELAIRMPEELRALEPRVRECIAARVNRGKLDIALKLRAGQGSEAVMRVDPGVLDGLNQAIRQVREHVDDVAPVDPVRLLQWPGVVASGGEDRDGLTEQVIAALNAAIDDFLAARTREGDKTAMLLRDRAEQIRERVATVRQCRPQVVARQKERLLAKLANSISSTIRHASNRNSSMPRSASISMRNSTGWTTISANSTRHCHARARSGDVWIS